MAKYKYYAVKVGRKPGIYDNWKDTEAQIKGFPGQLYRGFNSKEEALKYLNKGKKQSNSPETPDDLKEGEALAYVDGSFDESEGDGGYGVVFCKKGGEIEYIWGRTTDSRILKERNIGCELLAATHAYAKAVNEGVKKLYLYYDYQGIGSYIAGDFRPDTDLAREYVNYFATYIAPYVKVIFIKVKGHSGVEFNEKADELARRR